MKKNKIITAIAILTALTTLSINRAQARVFRVNVLSNYNLTSQIWGDNYGGTYLNPVFNTIDNAQNSSLFNDSDTLYLEGCPAGANFGGVAITNKVVIIGTGYFLDINANTSNNLLESRVNNIYFNTGSEGSQLIGVVISSAYGIQINVDNITIKRCYIPSNTAIGIKEFVQNPIICQNYFDNTTGTGSGIVFSNYGEPDGLIIKNNIFKRTLLIKNNSGPLTASVCTNNVFDCPFLTGGSVVMKCNSFKNNIIKTTAITLSITGSNKWYNTIATPTQLDTAASTNNKYVANMSNLFVTQVTNYKDANYRLNAGSVYNYIGSDGAPRGAFGGASVTSRYALSGNAAIPVVYDITTTGVATQASGLPVTIKARTIK